MWRRVAAVRCTFFPLHTAFCILYIFTLLLNASLILFAFSYECDEYNQCYKVYSMMMLELEGREKTATNAAVAQERNQWNLGKNKTEIFPFFPFISIVFNASSPIPALFPHAYRHRRLIFISLYCCFIESCLHDTSSHHRAAGREKETNRTVKRMKMRNSHISISVIYDKRVNAA